MVNHADNENRLMTPEMRAVYRHMIEHLGGGEFEVVPAMHGEAFTVKWMDGRSNPFAIIVNRNDLLFYFRKPVMSQVERESILSDRLRRDGNAALRLAAQPPLPADRGQP